MKGVVVLCLLLAAACSLDWKKEEDVRCPGEIPDIWLEDRAFFSEAERTLVGVWSWECSVEYGVVSTKESSGYTEMLMFKTDGSLDRYFQFSQGSQRYDPLEYLFEIGNVADGSPTPDTLLFFGVSEMDYPNGYQYSVNVNWLHLRRRHRVLDSYFRRIQ